jgi:hypothetical protein
MSAAKMEIQDLAENIALDDYDTAFCDLSSELQDKVYSEATDRINGKYEALGEAKGEVDRFRLVDAIEAARRGTR